MLRKSFAGIVFLMSVFAIAATGEERDASLHQHTAVTGHGAGDQAPKAPRSSDGRVIVHFPLDLRDHTLANMRDHLLALQQIEEALAAENFDKAGDIAEGRLGMSSLGLHGAHEVAKYMPKPMQEIGSSMHRSASQFARVAQDAAATGDMKPAIAALSRVTSYCVACHAGYRVQ